MSHFEPGRCDCSCHSSKHIHHAVACCTGCPYCHKDRIVSDTALKRHIAQAHPDKLDEWLKSQE